MPLTTAPGPGDPGPGFGNTGGGGGGVMSSSTNPETLLSTPERQAQWRLWGL